MLRAAISDQRAASPRAASPRPTRRDALPFLLVVLIGAIAALLPPYADHGHSLLLLLASLVATVVTLAAASRPTSPAWLAPVPAYLSFLVIACARDLTGGGASGLSPLVNLPLIWVALTGTRRQLWVASALGTLVFLAPVFIVGPPLYPLGDWRRALLWAAFALLVAPVVQRVVTQLGATAEAEESSRRELDAILRSARLTSIITTDTRGVIRSFSVGAEELLGYRQEDVVGKETPALYHDEAEVAAVAHELGVPPGFEVFATLAKYGAPSRLWAYRRADGDIVHVRLAITEMNDARTGELIGYLGVGIDSTRTIRAETARQSSEARWGVLVDHLPDLTVMIVDDHYVIHAVAGAGSAEQGFRDARGRRIEDVSGPGNTAVLERLIDEAVAGRAGTDELRATATGDVHEVTVNALPAENGEPRVMILARDVSLDRVRERETLLAKERAERLFTDAPHGVAILTPSGEVIEVNTALAALLHMEPDEVVGLPLGELSLPDDTAIDDHLAEVIASPGSTVDGSWTIATPEPRIVHANVSSRLLAADDDSDEVVIVNVVDVSDRFRYERELAHLADHDALTGLTNRRRFDEELSAHVAHCEVTGPSGALLLLDLDHFKEVNDTLGHSAGDELIRVMGSVLRRQRRRSDIVARLGGDEFAVLLPDADRNAAEVVAMAVLDDLRAQARSMSGVRRRVTASIGVVTVRAAMERGENLLALADMTMYDAKENGRDRYAVLDEDSSYQPQLENRLRWKARVEDALDHDGFEVLLQPILDLQTRRVRSAEALLRLREGDCLLAPIHFLPIAERSGLMPAVDAWVVDRSVQILRRMRTSQPDFELEVNLSGSSIGDPALEQSIVASIHRHGIEPEGLVMEVTETAAVQDIEVARKFAERMTDLGCKFALDDFGAGFGSFYYLKHLLFDYVKIDGEFVANCARSTVDRTILRSIAGIARDLGKQTIAEFVSDQAILDVVAAEGVDLAQGYLVGEPVTPDVFEARYLSPAATTHS